MARRRQLRDEGRVPEYRICDRTSVAVDGNRSGLSGGDV